MKYHRHKQTTKKTSPIDKKTHDAFLGKDNVCAYTLSTDSNGIAKLEDGSIVFVEDLLPGEKALIKIQSQKSTYKRATVLNRENNSEIRTTPPCPYFMTCGGCQIQHIKQENQINTKIQWFFETLKRVGKWDSEHIVAAEKKISLVYLKTDHYRRRIRLHYDGKRLGFHKKESNNIIAIESCYIARSPLNDKIPFLKNKLTTVYPELQKIVQSSSQLEFDIELTESDDEKVLLNFINVQDHKVKTALKAHFELEEDQLIHIKHPKLGKFKLKKESFIQPHFDSLNNYYTHISHCVDLFLTSHLKSLQTVHAWDLYAGSGVFSCIPYFSAKKLNLESTCIAVEGVKEAIDSLKLNYKDLPVKGLVQDVQDFIEKQFSLLASEQTFNKVNVVILDPPRSGVGIPNMQKLVELCAPESCLLYLACDPASFARDSRVLLEGGFHNKQIFIFDSFGQTNFYEVLGFFVRAL